ncbi:MAG: hypothetical protein P8Y53_07100 [Pseudolabrys sp.]|jgi:hypothetical protein
MTSRSPDIRRCARGRRLRDARPGGGLGRATAADLDGAYLRGPYAPVVEAPVRWDGVDLGGQIGYSPTWADFSKTLSSGALPNMTTDGTTNGGFLGYN